MIIKCTRPVFVAAACMHMLFLSACASKCNNESIHANAEIDSMKEQAQESFLRALELSLYYQGFEPSKIFHSFDGYLDAGPRFYDEVPRNSELIGNIQMRDASESFKWAQKAFELKRTHPLAISNLAKHYFSGIGVAQNSDKAKDLIESVPSNYPNPGFSFWNAYFYYKGVGTTKDLGKSKELLKAPDIISWKNFYTGKFAVYDRDFAKFILESTFQYAPLQASDSLYNLYLGKLNPEDKNEKKAELWLQNFNDSLDKYTAQAKANRLQLIDTYRQKIETSASAQNEKPIVLLSTFMLQKYIYAAVLFDKRVFVANPCFNPAEAEKLLRSTGLTDFDLYAKLCLYSYIQNGEDSLSLEFYNKAMALADNEKKKNQLKLISEKGKYSRLRNLNIPKWVDNWDEQPHLTSRPLRHVE